MLSSEEIVRTVEMLKNENLDVRTVTLGISLRDCASPSVDDLCGRVRQKIRENARDLVPTCERGPEYLPGRPGGVPSPWRNWRP